MKNAIHFIRFSDDAYNRAIKVWGKPDFVHRNWDRRAQQEVQSGDTAVFAKGTDQNIPNHFAFNDSEHQ